MSWFDAAGIANLAKTALKEAQKTIDKALDITEEEEETGSATKDSSEEMPSASIETSGDDIFSSWNVLEGKKSKSAPNIESVTTSQPAKSLSTSTSLWGSFAGSFFDQKSSESDENQPKIPSSQSSEFISEQPRKINTNRPLSLREPCLTGNDDELDKDGRESSRHKNFASSAENQSSDRSGDRTQQIESSKRREHKPSNINRLSVASSGSDCRSTESVEILGSATPDSDQTPSISTSSSAGYLKQSGSVESVEVITSPSSIEVLPSFGDSPSSNSVMSPDSHKLHSFSASDSISPVDQPFLETVETSGKSSNDCINDEEDMSIGADDSYNSASESTHTLTTAFENVHPSLSDSTHVKDLMLKSTSSVEMSFSEAVLPRDPGSNSRSSTVSSAHIAVENEKISSPIIIDAPNLVLNDNVSGGGEPVIIETLESSMQSSGNISVLSNVSFCDSPSNITNTSRTSLNTLDSSSCEEGTLMGSSSDETPVGSTKTMSLSHQTSTSSLKNMLAEAMTESQQATSMLIAGDNSPESRSELLKIGSSGHTSGDELETTTSSDIEIISSPTNGDSSSTTSRQSPAKLLCRQSKGKMALVVGPEIIVPEAYKMKGHQRAPSEASSGASDDSTSEVDKLLKKINEMNEVLEARESKLIDLSRLNAELNENNSELKSQLESQNLSQMNEEFTQRLAALERKFQQAIREKETLRKQLENSKAAVVAQELEEDKDQIIAELREEGEKLSKHQLALNNSIKKLKNADKDNQKVISSLREQLEETNQELERTKKALTAKEDVERKQIEAVDQLTKTNQKLEKEVSSLKSQVDNLTSTLVTSQKELRERRAAVATLEKKAEAAAATAEKEGRRRLEAELRAESERRTELENCISDLRYAMSQAEEQYSKREAALRQENAELMKQFQMAENRNEELAEAVSSATRPLTKQLENLTTSHANAAANWEKQEQILSQKLAEAQNRLSSIMDSERSAREQCATMSSQLSRLESKLALAEQQEEQRKNEIAALKEAVEELKTENKKLLKEKETSLRTVMEELNYAKREIASLEQQLSTERTAVESEKRKTAILQDQLRSLREISPPLPQSPRSSPAFSVGRASCSESVSGTQWPSFGDDERSITPGRFSNVYDTVRLGTSSTVFENLQSQLKLRDGEIQQLQWELKNRDAERESLSSQLSILTAKSEEQEQLLASLSDLQTQYDALLQLYGENLEQNQELRMDLQDVKEMYKAQIDQLLKREESG
nr:PREDICTED: TATA element modulatory factor [Bemisia tabaci]